MVAQWVQKLVGGHDRIVSQFNTITTNLNELAVPESKSVFGKITNFFQSPKVLAIGFQFIYLLSLICFLVW